MFDIFRKLFSYPPVLSVSILYLLTQFATIFTNRLNLILTKSLTYLNLEPIVFYFVVSQALEPYPKLQSQIACNYSKEEINKWCKYLEQNKTQINCIY